MDTTGSTGNRDWRCTAHGDPANRLYGGRQILQFSEHDDVYPAGSLTMGRDDPNCRHNVDTKRHLRGHNGLLSGNTFQHLQHRGAASSSPRRRRDLPVSNGMLPEQLLAHQTRLDGIAILAFYLAVILRPSLCRSVHICQKDMDMPVNPLQKQVVSM
jgi:hypothetical protein